MLLGAMMFVAACTVDSPVAPTSINQINSLAVSAQDKAAAEAAKDSAKAERERLVASRDSIREIQKARKDASRALKESLRNEWKAYKDAIKEERKRNKDMTVEFLRCEPQDYMADAEVIGPDGGEIKLGKHKLVIPKGALKREVVITAEAPVSQLVEVEFEPHGLKFERPVQLVLSYDHCIVPLGYTYRIVYVNENRQQVLEFPPSKDDKALKEVKADIGHFSGYVVAW
jgi:hypothetical protein